MKNNSVLQSKFFIPHPGQHILGRQRLFRKLDLGLKVKLTSVITPPGFGKTVLLGSWIADRKLNVSWFSLDRSDNEPMTFLKNLIYALRIRHKNVCEVVLQMLDSAEPFNENIVIQLINNLIEIDEECFLVLDDCHLLTNSVVKKNLEMIISSLPKNVHMYLLSRETLPLPLSKLRMNRQLITLTVSDIQFNDDEADTLLNGILQLNISSMQNQMIVEKTEGWAACIQLAALSLEECRDKDNFINVFNGNNRYVVDYLVDVLLGSIDNELERFLLDISPLEQFSEELCDAVRNRKDSSDFISKLKRKEFLIYSLDDFSQWYRFHHLFADHLRARLKKTDTTKYKKINASAAQWFYENRYIEKAINCAVDAKEFELGIQYLEQYCESVWNIGNQVNVLHWLKLIPKKAIESSSIVNLFYARDLFFSGNSEEAFKTIQNAENAAKNGTMLGRIAAMKLILSVYAGQLQQANMLIKKALKLLPENNLSWRGLVYNCAAVVGKMSGLNDVDETARLYKISYEHSLKAGKYIAAILSGSFWMNVERYRINIDFAIDEANKIVLVAKNNKLDKFGPIGNVYTEIAELLMLKGNVDEALELVKKGFSICEKCGDMFSRWYCFWTAARVYSLAGDYKKGNKLLREIYTFLDERLVPPWVYMFIYGDLIKNYIANNDIDSANKIIQNYKSEIRNGLKFTNFPLFQGYVRLLLVQKKYECAYTYADELLTLFLKDKNTLGILETLVIKSLIFFEDGKKEKAGKAIIEALKLSEKSNIITLYSTEGYNMSQLLTGLLKGNLCDCKKYSKTHVKQILKHIQKTTSSELKDEFSIKEYEVLTLLSNGLKNVEIAEKAFISVNTVKTHLKNINVKLNTNNRTLAVSRARELGLID